jgi:hypothetical protein
LVVDASGEVGIDHVDRERGVAVAMPLRFKLLDTDTVRDWLRRWSKEMRLTARLAVADLAATVDDTTGWANGDAAWLGLERIVIGTVAGPTSITNLTRGTVETLVSEHRVGTTAQVVTDRPRFWRGRDVVLWAVPVDPGGVVPGATLLSDAIQVWRGRIELGPIREIDGFAFEAADFGRVLDQGLVGEVSGTLVDTSSRYAVSKGWTAGITLEAMDGAGAQVWVYSLQLSPFAADADGDLLSAGEIRARVSAAWSAEVSAAGAGADLGDLVWVLAQGLYRARVEVVGDPLVFKINRWVLLDGKDVAWEEPDPLWYAGMPGDLTIPIGWASGGNPLVPFSAVEGKGGPSALTVRLDSGAVGDVPSFGRVRITIGNASWVYSFGGVGSAGSDLYLSKVAPLDGAKLEVLGAKDAIGAAVEVLFTASGTPRGLMLATLESSGTAALRGAYDILARGQGYSIDESAIDLASFAASSGPLSSLWCDVCHAGGRFDELFGGLLGLFRAAVVCRPDVSRSDRAQKLALVSTAPYGSGWSTTIGDADLLSHTGDPVLAVERAESPNVVRVSRPVGLWSDAADAVTLADHPAVEAQGRRETEYRVPATSKDALWPLAKQAAASHLAADQTLQVLSVRVAPWVRAEVGDVVRLDLSHPAIWTWAANPGAAGYDGPARVVGRKLNLRTLQASLVLLIDGALQVRALSPAAAVLAFQHATNPTWIEIDLKYLGHMQAALADAGGPIWLYHFQVGQTETVGERHQVSAAAEVGAVCRLSIAANPTGHTLSTSARSTLTLPTLDGGHVSAWQGQFAHVDDGTQWG